MSEEKTEALPQRLRREAVLQRGLPRSYELTGGVLLLFTLTFIYWHTSRVPSLRRELAAIFDRAWQLQDDGWAMEWWVGLAILLCLLFGMAIVASVVQGGWVWRPAAVLPKGARILPHGGFHRGPWPQRVHDAVLPLIKTALLFSVAIALGGALYTGRIRTPWSESTGGLHWYVSLPWRGLMGVAMAWTGFGVLDAVLRAWLFRRASRMTREMWREHLQAVDGNPEIRRRQSEQRQQLQRPQRSL